MSEDYEMESSSEALNTELEEGEVLQDAELVCVDQEEMDRLTAEGIQFLVFLLFFSEAKYLLLLRGGC